MTAYAHPRGPRDYIEMGLGAPEPGETVTDQPENDDIANAILALAYETRRQTDVLEKRARLAALTAADRGIRLPNDLYELMEEEQ